MELPKDEVIDLKPGVVIMINPGIHHRGYGDFRALIIGIPALQENDEHFV